MRRGLLLQIHSGELAPYEKTGQLAKRKEQAMSVQHIEEIVMGALVVVAGAGGIVYAILLRRRYSWKFLLPELASSLFAIGVGVALYRSIF